MDHVGRWMCAASIAAFFSTTVYANGTTNDEENYRGDRLSFANHMTANYKPTPTAASVELCIPAGTTLRGVGKVTGDADDLFVRLATITDDAPVCKGTEKTGFEIIPKGVTLQVVDALKPENQPNRYGLTYGALVVPFKYHFSGSESFNGNSTVGPFLGYRFDKNTVGVQVKLVGFLGGAAIEVEREKDGASKKETLAGFSYGFGLLGVIKDEFQLGLVFGADKVSKASDYEDDGKVWGAVAIGFSFQN